MIRSNKLKLRKSKRLDRLLMRKKILVASYIFLLISSESVTFNVQIMRPNLEYCFVLMSLLLLYPCLNIILTIVNFPLPLCFFFSRPNAIISPHRTVKSHSAFAFRLNIRDYSQYAQWAGWKWTNAPAIKGNSSGYYVLKLKLSCPFCSYDV